MASIELLTASEIMLLARMKILNNQNRLQKFIGLLNNHNVKFCNVCASDIEQLPKLPLPKLEHTMEKYLKTVQPFLNQQEFERTSKSVRYFQKCTGRKLQKLLEERANNHDNWLADWWLDTAYLSYRDPVLIYSSPGLVFPFEDFENEDDQFNYTAKLILAAIDYKQLIDSGCMEVEKMGKDPLDMNQYNKIFGTCRIPGVKIDHLEFNPQSTHITIVKNNNFFKVNVIDPCGNIPSVGELLGCLKEISKQSEQSGPPVGILTANDRNSWGRAYQDLTLDPNNLRSIRAIQTSLFLVCLDRSIADACTEQRSNASKQTIHGGGSEGNAANRWYDKTIQFVVSIDGTVGLTYEHSPSEGQPIAIMVDYLMNYIKKSGCDTSSPDCGSDIEPEKLQFCINDKIQRRICQANNTVDKLVERFDMDAFQFKEFGKEFIKSQKLSPDSFIQIAMQCAFYRLHNVPGAQYESAATRKYIHGRTETIRSCSIESIDFAKMLINNCISKDEKIEGLKKAINSHKNYTIEAVNGHGVDRHLLGLKLISIENGYGIPEFFKDPSYTRSVHMRISSSQVATKCDAWMCYGPLTEDGYGCCYNPLPNEINFAVSAWIDNPETSATKFRESLESSLIEMQKLLADDDNIYQKSKL